MRFNLDEAKSPTYYNLSKHLQEQGWKKTRYKWLAAFDEGNLQFEPKAAECLEFKHLLANLVARHCPDVMPLTYCINDHNWVEILHNVAEKHSSDSVWILKPSLLNNGKHIKIFTHINQLEQHYLSANRIGGEHVLQQYIVEPHLLQGPKAGHKYSIRMFVVITNYAGFYIYPNGYFNVALNPYAHNAFDDLRAHLTNEHLSDEEFNVVQIPTTKYDLFKPLYPKIETSVKAVMFTLQQQHPQAFICKKRRTLAIFGFDFIVDDGLRVWLIEANHGPCFPIDDKHPLQKCFYADFWRDLIARLIVPYVV